MLEPHLVLSKDENGHVKESMPLHECNMDQCYELKNQLMRRYDIAMNFNQIGVIKQLQHMIQQVEMRMEGIEAQAAMQAWEDEKRGIKRDDGALPMDDDDEIDFLIGDD